MMADFANDWYRAALLLSIPVVWCLVCLILSWASGWWVLSKHYSASQADVDFLASRTDRRKAFMRTGMIGPINYHSTLNFVAVPEGLRISVFFPFRLAHPPLFIPWEAFTNRREDSKLFSHRIKMSIGQPAITRVVFPGWVKYEMPPA